MLTPDEKNFVLNLLTNLLHQAVAPHPLYPDSAWQEVESSTAQELRVAIELIHRLNTASSNEPSDGDFGGANWSALISRYI